MLLLFGSTNGTFASLLFLEPLLYLTLPSRIIGREARVDLDFSGEIAQRLRRLSLLTYIGDPS